MQWWQRLFPNCDFDNSKQSTRRARPINSPQALLSAKCIHPRRDVLLERISQSFSPSSILLSHRFFTTRATFEERFTPLLAPAFFLELPFLALPPERAPAFFFEMPFLMLPLFPGLPVRLPPERAPLRAAPALKQGPQNLAL